MPVLASCFPVSGRTTCVVSELLPEVYVNFLELSKELLPPTVTTPKDSLTSMHDLQFLELSNRNAGKVVINLFKVDQLYIFFV